MSALKLSQVDAFPSPDKTAWETYEKPIYGKDLSSPVNEFSQIRSVTTATSANDLPLVISLNSLGGVKVNPVETKSFATTSTIDTDVEGGQKSLQRVLLTTIRLYPSTYLGRITPESLRGCHLIARQLGDMYDPEKKRFYRKEYLENDYLGVLATEDARGNTLIAFDGDWIIAGINEYIDLEASYGVDRTESLRENIATLRPILSAGVPIVRWENEPQLTGIKIPKNSLRIYAFNETSLIQREGNPGASPTDRKNSQNRIYMVFAPISADEAEKVFSYLYRNIQLYSFSNYLVVKNLLLSLARDFQYLFPVDINTVGDYIIFKSDKMSRDELERAFNLDEVSFQFSRLNNLVGQYAAYLLTESTYYRYNIRWEDRTLYIKGCGYIQALDLQDHFTQFLSDINREQVKFQKIPNFATAIQVAKITGSKCFYHLGEYYAALYEEIHPDKSYSSPIDPGEIEMADPLRAVHKGQLRSLALNYLSLLGYNINKDPEPYTNNIKLGYRTYQNDLDIFTVYYYETTYGEEMDVHEIECRNDPEIKEMLEKLLQFGWFFNQKIKNITRGYPNFIPSIPPFKRDISKNPKRATEDLQNILRGFEDKYGELEKQI